MKCKLYLLRKCNQKSIVHAWFMVMQKINYSWPHHRYWCWLYVICNMIKCWTAYKRLFTVTSHSCGSVDKYLNWLAPSYIGLFCPFWWNEYTSLTTIQTNTRNKSPSKYQWIQGLAGCYVYLCVSCYSFRGQRLWPSRYPGCQICQLRDHSQQQTWGQWRYFVLGGGGGRENLAGYLFFFNFFIFFFFFKTQKYLFDHYLHFLKLHIINNYINSLFIWSRRVLLRYLWRFSVALECMAMGDNKVMVIAWYMYAINSCLLNSDIMGRSWLLCKCELTLYGWDIDYKDIRVWGSMLQGSGATNGIGQWRIGHHGCRMGDNWPPGL